VRSAEPPGNAIGGICYPDRVARTLRAELISASRSVSHRHMRVLPIPRPSRPRPILTRASKQANNQALCAFAVKAE
jgi:transposase InsO family protein